MPTTQINNLFQRLDQWRHLPAYQLERRVDIFFALYLADIIEAATTVAVDPNVLPELPIKRDLIWPETPSNQSVKVDYAVFARDRSKVFFVELKTDAASRRGAQDTYLQRAQTVGLPAILKGLIAITKATNAKHKYAHLIAALVDQGCLSASDSYRNRLFAKAGRSARDTPELTVTIEPGEFTIEVLYIEPVSTGKNSIGFAQVAELVSRHDDPLSRAFAAHLLRWVEPAGTVRPQAFTAIA